MLESNPPVPDKIKKFIISQLKNDISQSGIIEAVSQKFGFPLQQAQISVIGISAGIRRHKPHKWLRGEEKESFLRFLQSKDGREMPLNAIAEKWGVTSSTVGRYLKQLGIQRGEARGPQPKRGKSGRAIGKFKDFEAIEAQAFESPIRKRKEEAQKQRQLLNLEAHLRLVEEAEKEIKRPVVPRILSPAIRLQIANLLLEPNSEMVFSLEDLSKEYKAPLSEIMEIASLVNWPGLKS